MSELDREIVKKMVEQEVQLKTSLTAVIHRFYKEFYLTSIQIAGVLEMIKMEVQDTMREPQEVEWQIEDDDDEEDGS